MIIPHRTAMSEYLNLSLNKDAATQPVQAPVNGSGIATKSANPIASYFSIILAFLFVLSKNQSKNLFNGPHLLKNSLIGLKKRSSTANTGYGPSERYN